MLSPKIFAASRKTDEHCWALFSDIHLAGDPTKLGRGINMTDNFTAVVNEVRAMRTQPGNALICGDLAFNSGETADYAQVVNLLQPLRTSGMPIHLALGNHDNRERFWDSQLESKTVSRPLQDRQAAIIRAPRVNWFVLDSLDKTLSTPGVLGKEQLAWLAKSLDANTDKPALVMVHHNPDEGEKYGGLTETKEFFEIIRPRKQVKAYLYGHSHHWNVKQDESGIHLINLPTTAYLFDKESPNGWVLANLKKGGMRLELRCRDRKHSEHGRVTDLKWRT